MWYKCNQNQYRLLYVRKHLSKPSGKQIFLFWYSASRLVFPSARKITDPAYLLNKAISQKCLFVKVYKHFFREAQVTEQRPKHLTEEKKKLVGKKEQHVLGGKPFEGILEKDFNETLITLSQQAVCINTKISVLLQMLVSRYLSSHVVEQFERTRRTSY